VWKSLHVHNWPLVVGLAIFICQKLTAYNRSVVVMGSMFWKGGSQEITKLTTIAWLKMEDAYILCNVIETFWWRKVTKVESWGPFAPFKFQMALAQLCKNTSTCSCKQPNTLIAKEMNWFVVCRLWELISLAWATSEATNSWVAQYQESKYA